MVLSVSWQDVCPCGRLRVGLGDSPRGKRLHSEFDVPKLSGVDFALGQSLEVVTCREARSCPKSRSAGRRDLKTELWHVTCAR